MIPRSTPRPAAPAAVALQWANGKSMARSLDQGGRFTPLVGFHIQCGRDAELDRLLHELAWPRVEIRHQRPGGAEVVQHWDLSEELELLPITAGPVATTVAASLANGAAAETAAAGIGLHWPRGEGQRSRMAVRGIVRALWEAGYPRPVQLGVRSRMTDKLLAALLDHTRAAVAADALAQAATPGRQVSPAELWLPLGAGAEEEFGRGDTATVTPLVSRHPAELSAGYLRSLWRPADVWRAALEAWPPVQAWAKEYQLTGGDEAAEGDEEEAPAPRRGYGRH